MRDLANQFEVIDQIITTPEQLDDLEYRCVSVQHRLLSYEYSCPSLDDSSLHAHTTIRQLCLIATLIFFGKSRYSGLHKIQAKRGNSASGVWRFPDVLPETVQFSEAVSLTSSLLQQLNFGPCDDRFADVLLWASFFAGFTALGTQRKCFIVQIKTIAQAKGIKSFQHVRVYLTHFYTAKKSLAQYFSVFGKKVWLAISGRICSLNSSPNSFHLLTF